MKNNKMAKKKKPEKIPHEEVKTEEHSKYEEEPIMAERSKYDENDSEEGFVLSESRQAASIRFRKSSLLRSVRAHPKMTHGSGSSLLVNSLNRDGTTFLAVRSPEAPTMIIIQGSALPMALQGLMFISSIVVTVACCVSTPSG